MKIHTETLEQLAQVAQNSLSYNQFYYQRDVHGEEKKNKKAERQASNRIHRE